MKNVVLKFEGLIRRLNYSQIQLRNINASKLREWATINMPLVIEELVDLKWDLEDDYTWTELMFINTCLSWYGKRVYLYITPSYLDFQLAKKLFKTKCFSNFRSEFKIDTHAVILVDPTIFLETDDLDTIYCGFDFAKQYSSIDFSHYDDEEDLEESYLENWEWLAAKEGSPEWSSIQTIKAFYKD